MPVFESTQASCFANDLVSWHLPGAQYFNVPEVEPQPELFLAGTHLQDFFDQYPEFAYDPASSSTDEFYRMCDGFGWNRGDEEKDEACQSFHRALAMEFNDMFGSNDESIETWRGLCVALAITPPPRTVKQAKDIFHGVYVNLVDVVDARRSGREIRKFENLESLREYTWSTGRIFPRDEAYAGGVLRCLLREITGIYEGKGRKVRRAAKGSSRGKGKPGRS